MKITEKEKEMIINIAENKFAPLNYGIPTKFEETGQVWADCLDCGPCKIPLESIPGRVGSLVKKGLVDSDGETGKEAGVSLTEESFKVYQTFNRA